jgi:carbonic anhydrase
MRKIFWAIITISIPITFFLFPKDEKKKENPYHSKTTLERLIEGNKHFVKGDFIAPNRSEERRLQTLSGQQPFVAVLTCSDSRISPTIFFDTGIGDLFIVRTAGNVKCLTFP